MEFDKQHRPVIKPGDIKNMKKGLKKVENEAESKFGFYVIRDNEKDVWKVYEKGDIFKGYLALLDEEGKGGKLKTYLAHKGKNVPNGAMYYVCPENTNGNFKLNTSVGYVIIGREKLIEKINVEYHEGNPPRAIYTVPPVDGCYVIRRGKITDPWKVVSVKNHSEEEIEGFLKTSENDGYWKGNIFQGEYYMVVDKEESGTPKKFSVSLGASRNNKYIYATKWQNYNGHYGRIEKKFVPKSDNTEVRPWSVEKENGSNKGIERTVKKNPFNIWYLYDGNTEIGQLSSMAMVEDRKWKYMPCRQKEIPAMKYGVTDKSGDGKYLGYIDYAGNNSTTATYYEGKNLEKKYVGIGDNGNRSFILNEANAAQKESDEKRKYEEKRKIEEERIKKEQEEKRKAEEERIKKEQDEKEKQDKEVAQKEKAKIITVKIDEGEVDIDKDGKITEEYGKTVPTTVNGEDFYLIKGQNGYKVYALNGNEEWEINASCSVETTDKELKVIVTDTEYEWTKTVNIKPLNEEAHMYVVDNNIKEEKAKDEKPVEETKEKVEEEKAEEDKPEEETEVENPLEEEIEVENPLEKETEEEKNEDEEKAEEEKAEDEKPVEETKEKVEEEKLEEDKPEEEKAEDEKPAEGAFESNLDKKSKHIRKEFYKLKEKAIKTGLKAIGEPKSFDVTTDNIKNVYDAFEDMRKGLLAKDLWEKETLEKLQDKKKNTSKNKLKSKDTIKSKKDPKKYLVKKNTFKDNKPTNITPELLEEEIKEITKILKNYKYKAPKKSEPKKGGVLPNAIYIAWGKKYAESFQYIEKAYFNMRYRTGSYREKKASYDYKQFDQELETIYKEKEEGKIITEKESAQRLAKAELLDLQSSIVKLWRSVNDEINKNDVDERARIENKINEKDTSFQNGVEERKDNYIEAALLDLKNELNGVAELIKKHEKKPKNKKLRILKEKIPFIIKKQYEVQKKIAENYGAEEIYELNSFNIINRECAWNVVVAFKGLRKAVANARIKKLKNEAAGLDEMCKKLPYQGSEWNALQSRKKNIKEDISKVNKKIDKINGQIDLEKELGITYKDWDEEGRGELYYSGALKLVDYTQKSKAELMRLIAEDTTELKETQEKKIQSGGKSLSKKVKESVGEFVGDLLGRKVELSLDSGLVTDFQNITKKIPEKSIVFKDILTDVFSNRKNVYESWYKYICGIAAKADKFFQGDKNELLSMDNAYNARILLMFIFLRSLTHTKLKDLNSVRKGLKTFVKETVKEYEGRLNWEKTTKDDRYLVRKLQEAGNSTKRVCDDIKSNIFKLLNRTKNIKDIVDKKDCWGTLGYLVRHEDCHSLYVYDGLKYRLK